jgi:hypothetical protein
MHRPSKPPPMSGLIGGGGAGTHGARNLKLDSGHDPAPFEGRIAEGRTNIEIVRGLDLPGGDEVEPYVAGELVRRVFHG